MCGFLVEYCFQDQDLSKDSSFEVLLAMSKRRGPDHTDVQSGTFYKLGFNRLSILDLSEKGNQPIYSPCERYHVVYNGEVYNFKELSQEFNLQDLRSTSDTEVIVQLFDKIGIVETLNKLNGMFAIGFTTYGLVGASQFDQIFKHEWFKNDLHLRPEIMKEYFAFGYQQAPNTIYRGIFQLNPGELLKFDRNGKSERIYLTNFSLENDNGIDQNIESVQKPIKKALKSAINRQLRSDVPLATFLSGGIDSPLITAIASETRHDLNAFTVSVKNERLNEVEDASNYASHLGIKHIIKEFNEDDLFSTIDQHFDGLPEPFGDYSSIPTYLISKMARKKHTVMLSGDGGDELFFGYPRMLDALNKRNWFKVPFVIRKLLIPLLIRLKLVGSWAPYHHKSIGEYIRSKHCHISTSKLNEIFPQTSFSEDCRKLYTFNLPFTKRNLLEWMRYCEFQGHLQRVLTKVDRMSMANSLEVRIPFLDGEIMNLIKTHVPEEFDENEHLKFILKELMSEYYPKSIVQNKKKGFSVPINDWLRNELKPDLTNLVLNSPIYGEEYMNVNAIKNHVKAFIHGEHHSGWGVWIIYAWQKWAFKNNFLVYEDFS